MRPGCGSKVHDPDVARRLAARRDARSARLAAGAHAGRPRSVRVPRPAGPDRRPAGGAADRGAGRPDARRHVAAGRRRRRPHTPQPRAGHRREGRRQRRHGRLQAGVPAGGHRRGGGGLHGRLQPARRAGHDLLRRAAPDRQRTDPPRHRPQHRAQRLRPGHAGEPDRSAAPCSSWSATSAAGAPARSTCRRSASRASSGPASPRTRS